ncbi:MAG: PAS domain-containing sensor histidine kinase [Bacteroidales bacterium]|nr:PAS domain-containing sensor histidine kinase [Bacteroidales bacterium]
MRHITIFIFFIISNALFAQTKIDSLENALEKTSGINRIDILMSLSESYIQISPQKSIEYAREANILINNNNKKQKTFKNILIAGSTAILILLILYIFSFKNKIKANKILLEQNDQIRNKNFEIKQKTENLSKINRELEKLSIVASQTDNAIKIINPEGEIEWVNEGFTRLYGYTYEEYITIKGKTYFDSGSNPEIKETFNYAITDKKSQLFEANVVSKNGVEYRIHTTLTPVLNSENKVVRLIAIDSDVTKLKEAEDELQKLLVTKDKFFSIIAHDLKNPFNTLIGLTQLLVHGFDRMSVEKVKYFHNNLYQISKNGYELLVNLLEWSRSQMGNISYKPEIYSLFALVEETFSLYGAKAIQKEILLTNNLNKDSEILADKNMLKTIFRNLVSNALKFNDRGGVIEISEKDSDDFKEISIRDTGVGINPDDIKKLFRLDENYTTKGTDDEPGTGLGLLLCKEFVEKHEGSIRVESKVGFGSNFIFTLPQANKKPS